MARGDNRVRTILEVVDRTKPGVDSAIKGLNRLAGSTNQFNRAVQGLVGGRGGVAGLAGGGVPTALISGSLGLLAAGLAKVVVEGTKFSSLMESSAVQLDFSMRKMRGLADASELARDHLEQLSRIARESPLDLRGLVRGSVVLEGFGGAVLNNIQLIERMTDAMSVMKASIGPGGELQIIRQTAQLYEKLVSGRGVGEEVRVLAGRGIVGVRRAVEPAMAEIQGRGIQGTPEAQQIAVQAIMRFFEGFEGGAAATARTLAGLAEKAGETFADMSRGIVEVTGFVNGLKEALERVTMTMEIVDALVKGPGRFMIPAAMAGASRGGPVGAASALLSMYGQRGDIRSAYQLQGRMDAIRRANVDPAAEGYVGPGTPAYFDVAPSPEQHPAEIMNPALEGMTREQLAQYLFRRQARHNAVIARNRMRAEAAEAASRLPTHPFRSPLGRPFGFLGAAGRLREQQASVFGAVESAQAAQQAAMRQAPLLGAVDPGAMEGVGEAVARATELQARRAEQQRREQIQQLQTIASGVQGLVGGIQRGGVGGGLSAIGAGVGIAASFGSTTAGGFLGMLASPWTAAIAIGAQVAGGLVSRDRDRPGGGYGRDRYCPSDSFLAWSDRPGQVTMRHGQNQYNVTLQPVMNEKDVGRMVGMGALGA